jgi:hypothetical protein
LAVLVFELRASLEPYLQALFALGYFSDRVPCFLPRPAVDGNPSTYASCVAQITGMYHHTCFLKWGLTFCPGWPQTSILLISTFRVPRFIGMSHHTWPNFF